MDLGRRGARNLRGRSLFVPGRKRTGSERCQGSGSPPTNMTSPQENENVALAKAVPTVRSTDSRFRWSDMPCGVTSRRTDEVTSGCVRKSTNEPGMSMKAKDRPRNQPPNPSLPKEGNTGFPPRMRSGGGRHSLTLNARLLDSNLNERTGNVVENKGPLCFVRS